MLDILDFGIFKIPSYIFFGLLGGIAYIIVTIILLQYKEKYSSKIVNKLMILSVVLFLILYGSAFIMNSIFHSIEKQRIVIGGITWLGGVIITFPVSIVLIYQLLPELKGKAIVTFSYMIPGIVIAHAFGRIGCFMGGCCYGAVTDSIFGVSFPPGSAAAYQYPGIDGYSLKVLPTQLFEAVFEAILFTVMLVTYKKIKKYNFELYGISYGIFRFIIEFLRGDNRGSTGIFLSPSQLMSIIFIIMVILLFLYRRKKIFAKHYEKIEKIQNELYCENSDKIYYVYKIYKMYKQNVINYDNYLNIKNMIIENNNKEKEEE